MERVDALKAAEMFIHKYYPDCTAALLAGSVVRGEATETSDLDIIVFDDDKGPYRESVIAFDWPVEVFVHNKTSYQSFFESDIERARPSLLRMISEGIVLIDAEIVQIVKQQADELLKKGPAPWSEQTLRTKRYMLTDALDDFQGSTDEAEAIFIANTLADRLHEFFLRTNGRWIGDSKWVVRALREFDPVFTDRFVTVFDEFYRTRNKHAVIELVEEVLTPFGGRLFEGYSVGK
ncbi:nucleotidyltransferase domain-containing protein [Sporosarcina cyprini]|uniref:nucleotidyltransferase domain-containing protein n=1 Tax=Sporosarcina cyprini TaxID=2910523 RepID=UPI001EDC9DBF|nr:nucleotidyltransferase domain-containing protein [Sporosarcina cyprini]MCG3086866.1 nucleotidyltransferase domain-containing protein [Sporosarcina cyprini]